MSTLKLTDEQASHLYDIYNKAKGGVMESLREAFEAYTQMIQESKTHWIVEAPKGHQFAPDQLPHIDQCDDRFPFVTFQFRTKPIPAPCPPPKLDPVTVEQVYGDHLQEALRLCAGKEAVFGQVGKLRQEGFTDVITANAEVWPACDYNSDIARICLRKWPA
jgi:hypothetical protein